MGGGADGEIRTPLRAGIGHKFYTRYKTGADFPRFVECGGGGGKIRSHHAPLPCLHGPQSFVS